jgi:hypothetical protein
MPETNLLL